MSFGYNEPEDRLVLLVASAAGEHVALLFTRRLTGRLINGLAAVLERSSAAAKQAPAGLRGDVVLLEHQGALSAASTPDGTGEGKSAEKGNASADRVTKEVPVRLVASVSVTTKPDTFEFSISDAKEALATFAANRTEVHRLLDVLARQVKSANWNLQPVATWLEPGQTSVVLN
jgi:hypothetical protein